MMSRKSWSAIKKIHVKCEADINEFHDHKRLNIEVEFRSGLAIESLLNHHYVQKLDLYKCGKFNTFSTMT